MKSKESVCCVIDRREFFNAELLRQGYKLYPPYKNKTIFGRIIREIWFRCGLPQSIWYNKQVIKSDHKYFFVKDSLITRKYLIWLRDFLPDAKIIFQYSNLVGTARHIMPKDIPDGIYATTYDKNDSEKYGLHLYEKGSYVYGSSIKKREILYDIVYVGRDKGRADYIFNLQDELNKEGLKTYFLIMPNGRFYFPKRIYSKPIKYDRIASLLSQTRAVLNIVLPGQLGATVRDYESIFNQVKLITNNTNIKNFDFYVSDNIFVLGERDIKELPEFLKSPFVPVADEILKTYTVEHMVKSIITSID